MLFWLKLLIGAGLPALSIIYAWSSGASSAAKIEDLTRDNAKQAGIIRVLEAREVSYKTRIDTRDRAIAQSRCAKQIQGWVLKPSSLPSPIPRPFSLPGVN